MSENSKPQHPTPARCARTAYRTSYPLRYLPMARPSLFRGQVGHHGMPRFFQLAGRINQDSLTDNPWADATMLHLEKLIGASHQQMQTLLDEVDALFADMPGSVKLTDCIAETPLNVAVHSHTPIGYRCVYLLVGFDQLALRVFQAHFLGSSAPRLSNNISPAPVMRSGEFTGRLSAIAPSPSRAPTYWRITIRRSKPLLR